MQEFEQLLEATKKLVVLEIETTPTLSGVEFENIVAEKMRQAAIGTAFEGTIIPTGAQTFPDIVTQDEEFGVEVKVTTSDKWVSTGNSILETTRKPVKKIYMFFGKLGGKPDIQYRPYEECLSEIVATHSPRYLINMGLGLGDSIFDKMRTSYEDFRSSSPIPKAQAYYKAQLGEGEQLWWIGSDDSDAPDQASTPLIIKQYNALSPTTRDQFIAEVMVLFPEIFLSGDRKKYLNASAFLMKRYGAVHPSMRDPFTAGGKAHFNLEGGEYDLPHIYKELCLKAPLIKEALASQDELLEKYWHFLPEESRKENYWLITSTKQAEELPYPSAFEEIYRKGLKNSAP